MTRGANSGSAWPAHAAPVAAPGGRPARMRAALLGARGGPEQLHLGEADVPRPGPGEVLVEVHAAGITPAELSWDLTYTNVDGTSRLPSVPSHEMSGVVIECGGAVDGITPGDAVYGVPPFDRNGAAAEFVVLPAATVAAKPRNVDHVHAAAAPLSGLTAWEALFRRGHLHAGQRVLIHGAAGGVGSFAVQLAHTAGAYVAATAAPADVEFVRSLGADRVADFSAERFGFSQGEIDLVIDPIGGDITRSSASMLSRRGVVITLPGPPDRATQAAHPDRVIFFVVEPDRTGLAELARSIEQGKVRVPIDRMLPLEEVQRAYERRVGARGKTVLVVRD